MKKFFVIKRLNFEGQGEWQEYYVETCKTEAEAKARAKLRALEFQASYLTDYEEKDVSIIQLDRVVPSGYRVECEDNPCLWAEISVGEEG